MEKKPVREPKQKRSAETRERIRNAALALFCRDGYYRTTTNAIAKEAGVPIGSLYSYFADKDALFIDILSDYNDLFVRANDEVMKRNDLYLSDKRAWLRALLESLIAVHEASRDFNREIKIMSLSRPDIAALRAVADENARRRAYEHFRQFSGNIVVEDIEAAATVAFTCASAVVDYLVFENPAADRNRILNVTVEGMYRALTN